MTGQVIWITGLSGAGKTTLAKQLYLHLQKNQRRPILLDGDQLRLIFNVGSIEEQSYSRKSRINLGLKYGLLCKNLSSQGFIVIIATMSMFHEIYAWNRENLENYLEIYLKVPLDELYLRDDKKIYQGYKDGILSNVAGLDLSVDEPFSSDLTYDFVQQPFLWDAPTNLINDLIAQLKKRSLLFHNGIENKIRNY